ncbi:3-hydroxyacyl-CoA dehydrogenase NAD-binding domain-containing protein [Nocardia sp. R6R-6]|uniref:3-hydroxyacyl-CoA dehydrogenase NAD-binding domain-containing protein n=1 Tax=Nocardia sp. R6R-6 TaxID=3459303 RepID=UPI00403D6B68
MTEHTPAATSGAVGADGEAAALEHVRHAERAAGNLPGLPRVDAGWRPGHAAVVGAGTMGGGIAMALANAGIPVTLIDRSTHDLDRGLSRVAANYASSVRRGRLDAADADQRLALIGRATDMAAIGQADVVVEAVFEELAVKQDVFGAIDRHARPGTLLATNTSALDIDAIASVTSRPEDVIGAHFFSPAQVMRLLEVVPGAQTAPLTVARLMALGRLLGKAPVRAGNARGFIGNAMLFDYHREALFLLEEGAFPADVDRVLTQFGFAMGPFTMTDMAGHDLAVDSRRRAIATRPTGRRYCDLDLWLVDLGRLGQKSGAGWYRYVDGDRTPHPDPDLNRQLAEYSARIGIERRRIGADEILERCLYALVNRAAWLLEQGVAAQPSDIDLVYVTGYGFPARKGGPLYWADSVGSADVLAAVERLHRQHGVWWEPAPLLVQLARTGAAFADLGAAANGVLS